MKFVKGKKVRIVQNLPASAADFSSHVACSRGGLIVEMLFEDEVSSKYCFWVKPVEYVINLSQFWVFPDWVEEIVEEKKGCTCSIDTLMIAGCKCGEIERERKQRV